MTYRVAESSRCRWRDGGGAAAVVIDLRPGAGRAPVRSYRGDASRRALTGALWTTLCVVLSLAPIALRAEEGPSPAVMPDASLRATLDRHLAAINARDLDALLSTVTGGDALTLILPNGKVLETREAFRELHVDWFKDKDWRMVFEIEDVRALGDVGIARVRYDSQARGADGAYASRRIARLTLVFAREDGGWRLVYDQNTPVAPPAVE